MKKEKIKWWNEGIVFGLLTYIFSTLLFPFLIDGNSTITIKSVLVGIPAYLICGLSYGWITQQFKKTDRDRINS